MSRNRGVRLLTVLLCTLLCLSAVSFFTVFAAPSYTQDFSSGSLEGFTPESGEAGNWTVSDGMLKTTGNNVEDVLIFGESDWTDYAIDFDFVAYGGMYDGGLQIYVAGEEDTSYLVGLRSFGWANSSTGNLVELYGKGGKTLVNSAGYVNGIVPSFFDEETMQVTIVVKQRQIRVFVNDDLYIDYLLTESEPDMIGKIGLRAFQSTVGYDNVVVREITDADLATPEPSQSAAGGVNSHITITTRAGQGDTSTFLHDPGTVGTALAVSVAAILVCAAIWVIVAILIAKNKKGDKKGNE